MLKINVVIVKHENCGAKCVFLVPEGKTLKAGDLVKVNTKRGKTLATCLCDSFTDDDINKQELKRVADCWRDDEGVAGIK